jgi:hypothetical protein
MRKWHQRLAMADTQPVQPIGVLKNRFFIYLFFLVHMLMFGLSGFFLSYGDPDTPLLFVYAHGGIAILVYTVFYLVIFGVDEVRWMYTNAILGFVGIYTQIGWLLSLFGRDVAEYPLYRHITPFLYVTLYTFLLRQFVLDVTRSRGNEKRQKRVEQAYVAVITAAYLVSYFL